MRVQGFTLLEVLLSLGMWSVLVIVASTQVFGGGASYTLLFWTERVADYAREAQARTMTGGGDDVFGLHIDETNDEVTLFKGASWGARDLTWDEQVLTFPDALELTSSVGDGGDIVFTNVVGDIGADQDVFVTNIDGENRSLEIRSMGGIVVSTPIIN